MRPVLLCVLKGGFIFTADLIRGMAIDLEVDFIQISSYGDSTRPDAKIDLRRRNEIDLHDRHVLVVEDIVDSGGSVKYLREKLALEKPASLRFIALLDKKGRREHPVLIDYVGFKIADHFVVGYGLDYGQIYRNLRSIHILTDVNIDE